MKHKISKEQWLDKALEIICRQEFGALRIDRLVRVMGVTKGSFYWHFTSRHDFIVQLIEYWDQKFTSVVIDHINDFKGTPSERLHELMRFIVIEQLAKYDFAIQTLTQNEPEVYEMIRDIIKKRVGYVTSMFSDLGFRGEELKFRSRALVMYMSQQQNNIIKESVDKQLKSIEFAHRMFTKQ